MPNMPVVGQRDAYWVVKVNRATGVTKTTGPYFDSDEAHDTAAAAHTAAVYATVVGRR
jgi:hypothetical protein